MDPAAPNYDRPPANERKKNRRRNLTRIQPQAGSRPMPLPIRGPSDAIVPPKPIDRGNPFMQPPKPGGLGPGSVKGAAALGLASGPQSGNLGSIDKFKAAQGAKPGIPDALKDLLSYNQLHREGGAAIGLYNATHKQGEPIKNLIAKLKQKRAKKPSASYTPASGSITSTR